MQAVDTRMTGFAVGSPQLVRFRKDWLRFTQHENQLLSSQPDGSPSTAQSAMIDLWTGAGFSGILSNKLAPQMELEALIRARSRALAAAFERDEL